MKLNQLMSWQLSAGLVAIALLASACGPDDENNKTDNNTTTQDMSTQDMTPGEDMDPGEDMTPGEDMEPGEDMTPGEDMDPTDMGEDMEPGEDMDPTDMGEDMEPGDMGDDMDPVDMGDPTFVDEVEPNNDPSMDTLTSFTPGDTVRGTIGAYDGNNDIDVDFFRVTLSAGDVFEWTISATGDGLAATGLGTGFQAEDGSFGLERYLSTDDTTNTRQVFIPEDGEYLIYFFDLAATADEPANHGGDTSTYEVSTALATLSPAAITVPGSETGDKADGALDAYSFTWSGSNTFSAEVFGARAPVESDIDPVLFLWDVAAGSVIGFNDDIDVNNGDYDSALLAELEDGKEYYLLLDAWSVGAGTEFQLDTDTSTRDADSGSNPTVINLGDQVTEKIGAADAADDYFDTDYYALTLQPGETAKIEVSTTGMLNPRVDVLVDTGLFGFQGVGTGVGVEGLAGVTINHPSSSTDPATYFVLVNDEDNIPADEMDTPDYIGGDTGYDYTLDISSVIITPVMQTLPFSVMSTYSAPGNYAFYEAPVVAESLIQLNATSTNADPLVAIFTMDGILVDETFTYKPGANGNRILGTRDASFRGDNGASTFDFDLSADVIDYSATSFATVAELPTNQSAATPQPLVIPSEVNGVTQVVMDGDPSDYFSFTAVAGEKIGILTEADPNAPLVDPADPAQGNDDADTVVTVYDAMGNELASNDDLATDEYSTFSALIFEAPADGTYTIEVAPYSSGDANNGYYILKVFK